MKPLIIDNFIDEELLKTLNIIMLGGGFGWGYSDGIVAGDKDNFQFFHSFYTDERKSFFYHLLEPILQKIEYKELYRIKANLITKTPEIVQHGFHCDMSSSLDYTTGILYMNTNDGYTEFEDGTKIESVANRFITFPEKTKHRGTSCTNENVRIVINFNFLT